MEIKLLTDLAVTAGNPASRVSSKFWRAKLCAFAVGLACSVIFTAQATADEDRDDVSNNSTDQTAAVISSLAKIEVSGDKITYDGTINRVSNEKLFKLYNEQQNKPDTLVVTSVNATLDDALVLGEWVLQEQLKLHIPNICAGFCATYVFAAATEVTLNETAIVAWPGNSPTYHDAVEGTSNEKPYWDAVKQSLVDAGYDPDEVRAYWDSRRRQHRKFNEKTQVDLLIALAQFVAVPESQQSMQDQGVKGPLTYTLTLDDMRIFGRNNLSVVDGAVYRPQDNEQFGEDMLTLVLVPDAASRIKDINDAIVKNVELNESGKDVYSENGIIYYIGEITASRNQRLFELYESLEPKPETFSVTSPGGGVADGMDLGDWVFDNKLKVRIPEMCGSSCANYILTAARSTELARTAIIFWHGSPIASDLAEGEAEEAESRQQVREEYELFGDGGDDPDAFMETIRNRNRDFFKKIGVNPLITVVQYFADASGQQALSRFTSYKEYGVYIALEDLPLFDINNVTVAEGKTWSPSESPMFQTGYVKINLASDVATQLEELADKLAKFD